MSLTESLIAALLLGVAGSTHCLGMCGAISINLSFSVPAEQRSPKALLRWHILFSAGRISLYILLGALSGALGSVARDAIPGGTRIVMLLSAAVLIMIALHLIGRSSGIRWLEAAGNLVWQRIQPFMRSLLPIKKLWQAYTVGLLWGFMPCGLIYTALALAAGSANALSGALLMAVFGAITIAPVAGAGILAGSLSWLRQPLWRNVSAAISVVLAVLITVQAIGGHHHGADTEEGHQEDGHQMHEGHLSTTDTRLDNSEPPTSQTHH